MSGAIAIAAAPPAGAGPVWSVSPNPNPAGSSSTELSRVSCPRTNRCVAVGSFTTSSTTKTLVESWNGTDWSIVPSPNPHAAAFATLNGVSCATTTNCFAVGYHSIGSRYATLVEHWDGMRWSVMTSPNPTGSTFAALNDVSCPTVTRCVAVGYQSNNAEAKTLVEHWNGTRWSTGASPNPTGSFSTVLNGVSCPNPNHCVAVGYFLPSPAAQPLVESWNGTSWQIIASPKRTGARFSLLSGVSCPGATNCFAVGFDSNSGYQTLVEHWNGTTWSVMTSPNHPGSYSTVLSGVSCPSTTSCFAVGNYTVSSPTTKTLVEHWNGTSWTIVASPNPTRTYTSGLNDASCANTTHCFAVGTATKTLIERYT